MKYEENKEMRILRQGVHREQRNAEVLQREVRSRSKKGKEEKDTGLHERRRTAGGITGAGVFHVLESRRAYGLHTPVHL